MKVKLLKPSYYHGVPDLKDVRFPVFTDTFSKVVVDMTRHVANFVKLEEQEYPLWYFEYETVIDLNLFENYTYEDLNYLFYSINLLSKEIPQGELMFNNNEISFKEHYVELKYDIPGRFWSANWLKWLDRHGDLKEFNSNVVREFKKEAQKQYIGAKDEPVYLLSDNKPVKVKIKLPLWKRILNWFKYEKQPV